MERLRALPWWGQIAVGAVVALLFLYLGHNIAPGEINNKKERVASLQEQLDQRQAEIRKARQAVAKLDELEREIADLELKLADLRQILPTGPELGDLLKWIKSLADQTNLDLRVFNPQNPKDSEFLREQPIGMSVNGNYHQLGMFFDRISKYARIINVENVAVSPNRAQDQKSTIGAEFTAKTYIYRDESGGGA